jgi:hypothetical protein
MFGHTPTVPPVPASGNYIQPNLGHGLRIWWAFFWRNTLISAAAGFLLGIVLIALARYISIPARGYAVTFGGYLIEYIAAIFVIHFIARKKFREFRIILTVQHENSVDILEPTFDRTFRIWWTYTWRSIVYLIALSVAMYVPLGFLSGAVAVIFPPLAGPFVQFARIIMEAAVGLFTIYSNILDEDIAGFRVGLAPRDAVSLPSELPNLGPLPGPAAPAVSKQ